MGKWELVLRIATLRFFSQCVGALMGRGGWGHRKRKRIWLHRQSSLRPPSQGKSSLHSMSWRKHRKGAFKSQKLNPRQHQRRRESTFWKDFLRQSRGKLFSSMPIISTLTEYILVYPPAESKMGVDGDRKIHI